MVFFFMRRVKWMMLLLSAVIVYKALQIMYRRNNRESRATIVFIHQDSVNVNDFDREVELRKTQRIQLKKQIMSIETKKDVQTNKISREQNINNTIKTPTKEFNRGPSIKSKVASTSDFSWKTLSEDWKLFSSYVDKRFLKSRHGVFEKSLVTMGYERGVATDDLLCIVVWANNTRSSLKHIAVRIKISEQWKHRSNSFRSYFYRCRLPLTDSPHYVTLISKNSTTATQLDTIPQTSFLPIVDPLSPIRHDFGVCIQTPLFGNAYKQIIIDSVEMNRLLGANWFTVYVHDGHREAMEILRSYSELGILEAVSNWGKNIPSPIYMKGVIVGINDCLYRNMYKVRYLVFCDFDEVIIPARPNSDWYHLLDALESKKRAFFTFHHVAFHRNLTATEDRPCVANPDKKYHVPQFLATRNRSVGVFHRGIQAKSVSKPRHCLYLHVHTPGELERGLRQYYVPPEIALLGHFRNQDDPRFKKYNSTLDDTMERYKWNLLSAVKSRICSKHRNG